MVSAVGLAPTSDEVVTQFQPVSSRTGGRIRRFESYHPSQAVQSPCRTFGSRLLPQQPSEAELVTVRAPARENYCKRLIRSTSRGNASRTMYRLHAGRIAAVPSPYAVRVRSATAARKHLHSRGSLMRKSDNRCADCGGKLGLVSHHHWGLRFCRKACKDNFLAKSAKDHARMRKWFGFFARATT
jgi:hypothetical protein